MNIYRVTFSLLDSTEKFESQIGFISITSLSHGCTQSNIENHTRKNDLFIAEYLFYADDFFLL